MEYGLQYGGVLTKKTMSQTERHFRMLEKAGLRSSFAPENTNTQNMLPATNILERSNKSVLEEIFIEKLFCTTKLIL